MENLTLDFNNFGSRAALGTYEKCDSLTLTIVLDEKDYAGYKFKIVAKKSDGHIIEQDIKEQDINREEKIIKTELNNQFTTKEGVVKLEINMIKDGKEDTTKEAFFIVRDTINGEVVESTSIIPTLEGVKAFIDEAVISLGDLEQAGEDIALINGEFKEAEIKRKANELLRERSEKERVRLESIRTTEEADRIKAEAERKEAENNRKVAESNRKLAENTRKTNEAARVEAELNRQSLFEENEEIRNFNENLRIEAEKERKLTFSNNNKFESERVEAEKLRAIAEDKRVTAEKVRAKAEEERVKAETRRENTYTDFNDSEVERRNNEANRVRAEAERVNAESGRNELFNTNEEKRNSTFIESERTRERAFNEAQSNRNEAYEESERVREEAFKVSEVARNEAEEGRVAAELLRVEAEKLRVAGEENRNNTFTQSEEERQGVFEEAENARKVAESKRVAAETGRVEAEKLRVTAETGRVEAENLRVTAEEERAAAETKREEGFNKFEGKINANTEELKNARSATTGEEFNSLDERIDCEVDRLNKKIDITMLQQEDKESHIIENSVEGLTTDMVIKGRTLQNVAKKVEIRRTIESVGVEYSTIPIIAKNNTEYTLVLDVTKNTTSKNADYWGIYLDSAVTQDSIVSGSITTGLTKGGFTGRYIFKFRSKDVGSITNMGIGMHNDYSETYEFEATAMLLEGDWTNKPIPSYFEGIKSFGQQEDKISILSGYNLIDIKKAQTGAYLYNNGKYVDNVLYKYVVIEAKTEGVLKADNISNGVDVHITYWQDENFLSGVILNKGESIEIKPPNNCNKIRISFNTRITEIVFIKYNKKDILLSQYGFDEGLRGFTLSICDKFNSINGVVTKRIGKYIFSGNENINKQSEASYTRFVIDNIPNAKRESRRGHIIHSKVSFLNDGNKPNGGFMYNGSFFFYINNDSADDIETAKELIRGTELYYELSEPVETPLSENINLKTFGERTYIGFENSISGASSFKAPVNAAATISRLNRENRALEEENAKLKAETYKNAEDIIITNEELQITQSAVDHLLFSNLNADGAAMLYNGKKKGGGSMGAYLAMRIIKGKLKYEAVMKQYGEFKEDIDLILEAEGYGHLITQQ